MIKVDLLHPARRAARKRHVSFPPGRKAAPACVLIVLMASGSIGWRARTLSSRSAQLDKELAGAQWETARLQSVIAQVQQLEQRKTQLQQRLALVEQLRKNQTGPVHMLDQISRALPPMLWLTELKQTPSPNEVVIDGRSTTMTSLSDFIANLEASGYFKRSVEIVSSTSESATAQQGEQIRFQIRAVFQQPLTPAPAEANAPVATAEQRQSGSF